MHQVGAELMRLKLKRVVGELQFAVNHGIASQVKSNWQSMYASYKRSCNFYPDYDFAHYVYDTDNKHIKF